ncbi:MAG TPA: secondary thiamine-phosphate synthase enzyme YjbQ, partial [Atribacterota bacterium]|nr:secondary thiamine-phosphate synthase enzyme YjbQ [Atribacterota bacterium]
MLKTIPVNTSNRTEMLDITAEVERVVQESNLKEGLCIIFVPHTTAAVTINENADPDVLVDILQELEKVIPFNDDYRHLEGNSAAHIKSSLIGSSISVIIENGHLKLGTWQGIIFCEFDGPRTRDVWIKIIS